MKKLRVVLDMDDVIVETCPELIKRTNKKYGLNLRVEDITDWDLTKVQPKGVDMLQFFRERNFYNNLKLVPLSLYYIKKIVDRGHDVIISSAAYLEGYESKYLYIRKFLSFIPKDNIMFGSRKDIIDGDVMLDDAIHNIKNSKCKYPIIFTRPWNIKYKERNKLRISSYKEFFDKVIEIENLEANSTKLEGTKPTIVDVQYDLATNSSPCEDISKKFIENKIRG